MSQGSYLGNITQSVSGMKDQTQPSSSWAVVYIERRNSSLSLQAPAAYGMHTLAGLVRVLPGQEYDNGKIDLRVFVDKSIVEIFAQNGRSVVTGRVYPTLVATKVGVYASGQGESVFAEAFAMGAAF